MTRLVLLMLLGWAVGTVAAYLLVPLITDDDTLAMLLGVPFGVAGVLSGVAAASTKGEEK